MVASATVDRNRGAGDSHTYFVWTIAIAAVYCGVHICARLLASPNLGEDDPLTNILVQQWAVGYSVWYPPMFEWMAWTVQQLTGGPSLIGFQLLKYALLIGTIAAIYWAAFYVTGDALWSLITAEALTLIYHVGWRFHEGFTGIIPAMFFSALALCFVLRIIERHRPIDFVWLGLAFGGGLLSTHNFAIGIISFLLAAMFIGCARRALFRWPLLLTLGLMAVVVAPYYGWIVSDAGRLGRILSVHSVLTNPDPRVDLFKVVRKTLGIPFGFFWSLLIFLLLGSLHRVRAHFRERLVPQVDWAANPLLAYLGLYALISYLLLFLSGVGLSYVRYASHHLLAFMVPVLVLMFGLIYLVKPSDRDMRRWGRICFAIVAFAFVARAANMFVLDPVCKICRWGIPYVQLADRLREAGYDGGTLFVMEPELGGNLRLNFPNAAVVLTHVGAFKPENAMAQRERTAVVVWQVGGRNGLRDPRGILRQKLLRAGLGDAVQELRAPWSHIYKSHGYRQTVWRYVVLPPTG